MREIRLGRWRFGSPPRPLHAAIVGVLFAFSAVATWRGFFDGPHWLVPLQTFLAGALFALAIVAIVVTPPRRV